MRVIAGSLRGRKLETLKGDDTRPTTDLVKEALFNILQFRIPGSCVLDLFAGSGQLGIECLSRGAESVVFVDKSPSAVNIIKRNLASCGLHAEVCKADAERYLSNNNKFDIVLVDPPYDSHYYDFILNNINRFDILNKGGIIVFESRKDRLLPVPSSPYRFVRDYCYGKIKISIYSRS